MDAGQISQGLRTDYMQQMGEQGVNVGQMMQSGVSFQDILVMIAAANRGMAIAPGMAGADALMQEGEDGAADAQSLLAQMKDMVQGDSLTQFIQGQAVMDNAQLKSQLSEVLDYMAGGKTAEAADVPETAAEEKAVETDAFNEAADEIVKVSPEADAEAAPKSEPVPEKAENIPEKAEDIPAKAEMSDDKTVVSKTENTVRTDAEAEKMPVKKADPAVETDTNSGSDADKTVVKGTDKAEFDVKADSKAQDIKADKAIPGRLNISEGKRPVIRFESGKVEADPEKQEISGGIEKNGSFQVREVYTEEWLTEDEGIVIYNPEVRQQLENIFKGIDPKLKSAEGVIPRRFNISDMGDIPRVILKTGKPELSDLNEITEPKADAQEISSGQKFVIDLLGSISKKDRRLDTFDFSEDIIKADPMQLAGLLDYIRTGAGIPLISDIADREVFRNINTVGSISAERIFDPGEMIKNGEMEIISYTPATDTNENAAGSQQQAENSEGMFGKDTMDFARLMKGVRERVNPFINSLRDDDDDDLGMRMTDRLTPEDMHTVARRMDISFDRALAELEMNKAEYGTPDEQVAKSVAQNLLRGRSEFTVKLRPEGLGEILVKLVSDDAGRTVLSMVASSQRTADLLNRDLASLQSQLSDHNVEIENNSVKVSETVMPSDRQSDAAFSQFDERRRDEGEQANRYRQVRKKLNTDDIRVGSTDYDTDIMVGREAVDDSALNITI